MVDGKELYLYPCGLIATSVFNDTFTLSKNKELSTDKEVTPPPPPSFSRKKPIGRQISTARAPQLMTPVLRMRTSI